MKLHAWHETACFVAIGVGLTMMVAGGLYRLFTSRRPPRVASWFYRIAMRIKP